MENVLMLLIIIVAALIVVVTVISCGVSLVLWFKYYKFNRTDNSIGLSGKDVARKLLDENELNNIKVSKTGSLLFGNSYSHMFKKVRLRRMIYNKKSLTSMGIASEKVALALLDKEEDKDMKDRIKLFPLINFGPLAFIPLVIVGAILDFIVFNTNGLLSLAFLILGLAFYVFAIVLSVKTLKTEKKAQVRAIQMLEERNMIEDTEKEMLVDLYRLYNIEYINDIVLSSLELIYRILQIVLKIVKDSKN